MTQEEQDLQEKRIAADILVATLQSSRQVQSLVTPEQIAAAFKVILQEVSQTSET